MIPFIEDEFVRKKRWLTQDEMTEMVVLSQSFPGVIAINVSIFVGNKQCGLLGAVSALLGTVMPALLSIILILSLLRGFEDNTYVKMVFVGIKAASAALILDTVVRLARKTLKDKFCWIAACMGLMTVLLGFSAAWAIVIGALAGIVYTRIKSPKQPEK